MRFYGCRSSSLPLGSQIISVAVNSSLSWHTNRLRDVSRDAYNVSYAWKLVSAPLDLLPRPPLSPPLQRIGIASFPGSASTTLHRP